MVHLRENVSLKPYNTFGIEVKARWYAEVHSLEDLRELLVHPDFRTDRVLWIGGGSNMLLTRDIEGWAVHIALKGKQVELTESTTTLISADAGENWHELVQWTLGQNLGGLENLSLIPGNVGTAPIQNIGAYGVELKDTFEKLEALKLADGSLHTFTREDCAFGYRDSVFKRELKGQYLITKVFFRLQNEGNHILHTRYGAIEQELKNLDLEPGIHAVSRAVVSIRSQKLPDPKKIGNSGSFFKNPVVPAGQYENLKKTYPDLVGYPAPGGRWKLAAGWLIEKAGWKGYRKGDAGVHRKQALVLVNYGQASGKEIAALAQQVQDSVFRTFAVPLEAEVNII